MSVANDSHFDFIVVGGGTAGNCIAGRLAENPNVKVLVIEAGVANSHEIEDITTPSKAFGLRGSQYDWAYKTTMIKRDDYERVEKPNTRGKALGGSSTANYFTWIPGSAATFDDWEPYGGRDWTWQGCVEYLRKCATYHDDEGLYPRELQQIGHGGPVQISHAELVPELHTFRDALAQAWVSKGEPLTEDIYSGHMHGLTHCVDSIYKGERQGSYVYLFNRPNVTVLSGAHSKRLLIDPATRVCSGVEVLLPATHSTLRLHATREVILSQGVFETPKLLMLSGVGPRSELSKHHIDLIVDSPHVGQHLLDHPIVPFVLRLKDGLTLDDHLLRSGPAHDAAVSAYRRNRTGPVSSGLLELVGFPRIDARLHQSPAYRKAKAANGGRDPFGPAGQPHFELDFVGMFSSAFQWHYPVPREGSYMTVIVDLLRPVSEGGEVTLNSTDPLVQPNINLNFFGNDLDIVAMREGVRWTYDMLMNGDGFKDLVLAEYPWEMPLHSDEAMDRAVLERSQTGFHPCGTARLSKSIQQGVVDARLRVHGIRNLRVADASVIPVIPDCRIQNSVYMIGEKGADLIKADHRDLYESDLLTMFFRAIQIGLPLGYLNQIEKRLADTEQALFEALTIMRELNASHDRPMIRATRTSPDLRSKSARMQEWSRSPLRDWAERERWWEAQRDQFRVTRTMIGSSPRIEAPPPPTRSERPRMVAAPNLPSRRTSGTAESESSQQQRSDRATEVAQRNPSLYF
ncbi:GMC family oxidoreductase [Aspergillus saccharolyticus JOP 1030-1]|uniref:FAD/NAD(P)-binding domain-containing protein n=1 Tax=Aspergillus saccharolyticus JOP 1030-1 TaxID=1450539 RepID=A0A319A9T6_9EURO|nr:FAD/NAD(P)-binding domain-containing protein [Aspergillus saccharolyticus JOP 1030-1]PYH43762.1 FAD/NAD(P)-binding domain-containing protein [Aspergillus saccharolyticus JOP 1030-1]